jgi:gliding motility-associated lipoprotein GldH
MSRSLLGIVLFTIISGCSFSSTLIFEEINENTWQQDKWKTFNYNNTLPTKKNSLFWVLRHDNDYPYSNIFFITENINPRGVKQTDTLSFKLARPDGSWLGTGVYVYEHRLNYKTNFNFDNLGKYQFRIRPAVRANDNLVPNKSLDGIHQIGLEIRPETNE